MVARDHLARQVEPTRTPAEDVSCRDRQVADQRRVGQVTEVGDAGQRQIVVHQHVGERQVVVHDLGAQPGECRDDALVEAVEDHLDGRPPVRRHSWQPRSQLREQLDVPGEGMGGGRVGEAAQPSPEPGARCPHSRRWTGRSSSGSGCRPGSHVDNQDNDPRPSRPMISTHDRPSRVGTMPGTGRSGAAVRRWRNADCCRSRTSSVSAGLCTLSNTEPTGVSRRKSQSRSPCSGVSVPSWPQCASSTSWTTSRSRSGPGTLNESSGAARMGALRPPAARSYLPFLAAGMATVKVVPLPSPLGHVDPPAVAGDDPVHDRQSQAGAGLQRPPRGWWSGRTPRRVVRWSAGRDRPGPRRRRPGRRPRRGARGSR